MIKENFKTVVIAVTSIIIVLIIAIIGRNAYLEGYEVNRYERNTFGGILDKKTGDYYSRNQNNDGYNIKKLPTPTP